MEEFQGADLPVQVKKKRSARGRRGKSAQTVELTLNSSGDWMEAEKLRTSLIEAAGINPKVILNLAELHHVDASAFQVLVAAARAGWFSSGTVRLTNVSDEVSRCFAQAGAGMQFAVEAEVA